MIHRFLPALILLASITGALAASPPISCGKVAKGANGAGTPVERTICASPEFKAMDREIAALYDRALSVADGEARHRVVAGQQAFLKRRGDCAWAAHHSAHPGVAVEECVRGAMDGRVASLRDVADGRGDGRSMARR